MNTKKTSFIGEKCFVINTSGDSMLPTIRSGDVITIDMSQMDYNIDDIVVFYSKESDGIKLVAHRITHIFSNKIIITKGDNNCIADKPIRTKKIIGKVIKIERKVR